MAGGDPGPKESQRVQLSGCTLFSFRFGPAGFLFLFESIGLFRRASGGSAAVKLQHAAI
jgi:hypothetical protein